MDDIKMELNENYQEILKLDKMLIKEKIPHEIKRKNDGWEIGIPSLNSHEIWIYAVEDFTTDLKKKDKIQVTRYWTSESCIVRHLIAEEAFKFIKTYYKGDDKVLNSNSYVVILADAENPIEMKNVSNFKEVIEYLVNNYSNRGSDLFYKCLNGFEENDIDGLVSLCEFFSKERIEKIYSSQNFFFYDSKKNK